MHDNVRKEREREGKKCHYPGGEYQKRSPKFLKRSGHNNPYRLNSYPGYSIHVRWL